MSQASRTTWHVFLIVAGMIIFGTLAYAETQDNSQQSTPSESAANAAGLVVVESAWIRPTAPGQTISGAFMTLVNHSAHNHALTAVKFNYADVVEIHETSMTDGRMSMRKVDVLEIPANGLAELKPGSYHVMLIGLQKSLVLGSRERLTLIYSDGSQKTIEAMVETGGTTER